jgi:hypothetical protein
MVITANGNGNATTTSTKGRSGYVCDNVELATQVSKTTADDYSSADDGTITAILCPTGIELRSNSSGERVTAYYFANQATTVAIQQQPPTVITEVNGHLGAWPSPSNK